MASARPGPRLLTISTGTPFLPCLAKAILSGRLLDPDGSPPDPLELPRMTLLLPTRRACKAMQDAFLEASGRKALLLPRIRPIGGGDEDAGLLSALAEGDGLDSAAHALDLPPAIDALQRQLTLTSLVMAWQQARFAAMADGDGFDFDADATAAAPTPAQASDLARGLASLMDRTETEGADLSTLAALAPDEFSIQWQHTLDFLKILAEAWPPILAGRNELSPAARRNRLLALETKRLTQHPPEHPYIIAGVTGSIAATARLIACVSRLANGAVVLSGLDQTLPDDAWRAVASSPSHPQFRLAQLLATIGAGRDDVTALAGPCQTTRTAFIGEALRPAATTSAWHTIGERLQADDVRSALAGIERLDAGSPEEEAEAVALILRRAAEDTGTRAALISPDRTLARRVAARLESWGITVDDSAGRPLAKTPPGVLLDLTVACLATDWAPATLLALLKHPLTRLGLPIARVRRGARMLELRALRRPNLGTGLRGIGSILAGADGDGQAAEADHLSTHHGAISNMAARDGELAAEVFERLEAAFAPLMALADQGVYSVTDLAAAHIATTQALATDEFGGFDALWSETSGQTAALYIDRLLDAGTGPMRLTLTDYPDFYRSLVVHETARQPRTSHPRLAILGPFEARLLDFDIAILGGLNDGVWPVTPEPDPWLNRQMLAALGLPQPETRIGDAAHDFVQLLGTRQIYLTRAAKLDGAPTVPSRWLLRIDALLAGLGLEGALTGKSDTPWLAWAKTQKALPRHQPRPAPAPCPPLAARPRKLSVTRIETWMANPYAIFARDILRLEPMPALGGPPEASVRGQIIHEALHRFSKAHPAQLPRDTAAQVLAAAAAGLARLSAHPRVAAFWAPRFARFADWFAQTEPGRRDGVARIVTETRGSLAIVPSSGNPFVLTARADRLDILSAGGIVITDYKTGTPPTKSRVIATLAPQLPLEAAIASQGGFEGVAAAPVRGLRYISATGGEPPGKAQDVDSADIAAMTAQCLAGLHRLIDLFDDPATAYRALQRPDFQHIYRHDDFAHLARVDEWSLLPEDPSDD